MTNSRLFVSIRTNLRFTHTRYDSFASTTTSTLKTRPFDLARAFASRTTLGVPHLTLKAPKNSPLDKSIIN